MHITKYNQLIERCRALTNRAKAPTGAAQPATALPAVRSLEQLTAEYNAITDPGDQTLWWRTHYYEIKRAQGREAYARANRPRNKFLNMTLPE
jgi:hypothetical protein